MDNLCKKRIHVYHFWGDIQPFCTKSFNYQYNYYITQVTSKSHKVINFQIPTGKNDTESNRTLHVLKTNQLNYNAEHSQVIHSTTLLFKYDIVRNISVDIILFDRYHYNLPCVKTEIINW